MRKQANAREETHDGHHDHVAMVRQMLWIMLALAVPTVLASDMFAAIAGYTLPDSTVVAFVSPVLGTVAAGVLAPVRTD